MMAHGRESALSIRQRDPDVLHHPLIFVIEDVAMQDKFADVTLITRSSNHVVSRLYENRVFPNALKAGVLRIVRLSVDAHILALGIEDRLDLERVHMNVERVARWGIGPGSQ